MVEAVRVVHGAQEHQRTPRAAGLLRGPFPLCRTSGDILVGLTRLTRSGGRVEADVMEGEEGDRRVRGLGGEEAAEAEAAEDAVLPDAGLELRLPDSLPVCPAASAVNTRVCWGKGKGRGGEGSVRGC